MIWFALAGPPLAWAIQFVLGYGVTEAACGDARLAPNVNAWAVVLTAVAAVVTILAGAAAVRVYRTTRGEDTDGAPPGGRVYFMSLVAMATTPLFLFIILMNGAGVLVLEKCQQS